MKEFIIKIYNNNPISEEELNNFIVEYCETFGNKKTPNINELKIIREGIQFGMFDLNYMLNKASINLNLNVTKIYDKNGQIIKVNVKD